MKLPAFMRKFVPADGPKRRLQAVGIALLYGIALCWWVMIVVGAVHDLERLPYAISAGAVLLCIPMMLEGSLQKKLRSDDVYADVRASNLAHREYILAKYYEAALPAINVFAKAVATATGEAARAAEQAYSDATAPLVKQRDDALAEVNGAENSAYEHYRKSVTMPWPLRIFVWLLGAAIAYELAPFMVEYVVPLFRMH